MQIYVVLLLVFSIYSISAADGKKDVKVVNMAKMEKMAKMPKMAKMAKNMEDLSTAVNAFSFKMQKEISKSGQSGNIIFAPFNVFTILCMLFSGAGGNTKSELATALQQEEKQLSSLLEILQPMNNMLSTEETENTLKMANKIWMAEQIVLSDTYKNTLGTIFASAFGKLSLTNSELSRANVNKWVATQTNNNIKELLPRGHIGPATKMVLTNAVYFKGKWENEFVKADTHARPFKLANGTAINVQYMFQSGQFSSAICAKHNVQLLELPYQGGQYSMIFAMPLETVVKPDNKPGNQPGNDVYADVGKLEEKITAGVLENWVNNLLPKIADITGDVQINVPKFKLKKSLELSKQLRSMGIRDLFTQDKADLSGMTDAENDLYINTAIHKAFITVDEEGTTAAAATGVAANMMAVKVVKVTLNRPFVFYLIHKSCNAIIFSGKVMNPNV